jgi:uncharacterized protein (PEP-CTERM system associated)
MPGCSAVAGHAGLFKLRPVAIGAAAVSLLLVAADANAQRWVRSASIDSQLTLTDNGDFEDRGEKKADAILQLTPRIGFRRAGGSLRLDGDASLSAYTYADGTQPSRIDPALNLNANLEAIDDFLFVDGSMRLQRTLDNPFGPQTPAGSSVNSQNLFQARISPYVQGNLGSRVRYRLRSDTSWTRSSGGAVDLDSQYATRQSAELSVLPRPVGLALTFDRDDSDAVGGSRGRSTSEIARAILAYSPNPQFTFGLRAGHEENNYPGIDSRRDFYGANASWRPTERTTLSMVGEKRFFGNGWQVGFQHRMPRLAWSVRSSRDVSTLPQRFLGLPVTQNVAGLIDASLTTRIPDPIERARAVEDLIVSRGLPRELVVPVDIFSERVEVQTANSATVALIGVRSTLALTAFSSVTEGLTTFSGPVPVPDTLLDNRQRGVGLTLGHQLSQVTTLSADASWRDTRGLGVATSEQTRQQTYQLRFTHLLTPKTTATGGARYQVFDSTVQNDTSEAALFVGLGHRF